MGKVQAEALPFPRKETVAAVKWLTDAGARDLYVVASLADVPERPPFAVIPLEKDAAKELAANWASGASNLALLRACVDRITTRRSAPRWWAAATQRSSVCTT